MSAVRASVLVFLLSMVTLAAVGLPLGAAQGAGGSPAAFKEDAALMTAAVDQSVSAIAAGPLLQSGKATYLDGFGLVVTVEVGFGPPRNPFSGSQPPEETRRTAQRTRTALKDNAVSLLREHAGNLESVGPDDRVAIVIHMLNRNPVDLPDLPTQLVVSARKQTVMDFHAGRIQPTEFASQVTVREY